jgi:hypothetical protein
LQLLKSDFVSQTVILWLLLQECDPRRIQHMPLVATAVVNSKVTSICLDTNSANDECLLAYIGTADCNIWQALVDIRRRTIVPQLVQSAHSSSVTAVAFPENYGEARFTPAQCSSMPWPAQCRESTGQMHMATSHIVVSSAP